MIQNNNLIRSFICIDLPSDVIKEVSRIQSLLDKKFMGRVSAPEARLRSEDSRSEARSTTAREERDILYILKFTDPENLHLTLKFLGEINEEALISVKSELKKISLSKFEARLEKIGLFTYRHNPRIAWIKIAGKKIYNLQSKIDESLLSLFPKEQRFMSHLTIARIKHVPEKKYFYEYIKNLSVKKIKFPVSSFKLKSSDLKPLGPVYTTIEEYKLK